LFKKQNPSTSQLEDEPPSFCKKWTVRNVTKEKFGDEIYKLAEEKSGGQAGSSEYLSSFPSAWSDSVKGLSKKQKDEFQSLADKWNKMGAPKHLQQK
jgi:hypothetical protein